MELSSCTRTGGAAAGHPQRLDRPQGVACEFPEGCDESGVPDGLLKARAPVVLNASNTPPEREKSALAAVAIQKLAPHRGW